MRPLIAFLLCLSLVAAAAPARAALSVSTGVPALAELIAAIGGEAVDVELAGSGADPHVAELSPRQRLAVRRAALYFGLGLPFEQRLALDTDSGPTVIWLHRAEPGSAAALDPHLWTSPAQLRRMGEQVREALIARVPEQREAIEQRWRASDAALEALQREIAEVLAAAPTAFVVDHPAWGWFAAEFGLEQIALEEGGHAASIADLGRVKRRARERAARWVVSPDDGLRARQLAAQLELELLVAQPLATDWNAQLRGLAAGLAAGQGQP